MDSVPDQLPAIVSVEVGADNTTDFSYLECIF